MTFIILLLFLVYISGMLYVFCNREQIQKHKLIFAIQKVLIFVIHGLGLLCLYLKENNANILYLYFLQIAVLSFVNLFYQLKYKKCSQMLLNNMCMLLSIGMVMMTRISFNQAFHQFVFILIGSIFMMMIPLFLRDGMVFRKLSAVYFVSGVVLLGVVMILGATSYGAKLALTIGNFSFQPSEFVKIIFVFFVASMLYQHTNTKRIILTGVLSAVFVLILVFSKDLGNALIFYIVCVIMIYVASGKKRYLALGFIGMVASSVAGYYLFSHVRTRVSVWLNPTEDIYNKGYQICRSLFAIGQGGWLGLGLGNGNPKKIPVVEKDFIFSAISEEFGALFAIGLIVLCASCFIVIIGKSIKMEDSFYKLITTGLAVLYATQLVLTIGGAIKFIPSTGVTLPLVSYGGSSMLSTLALFGIVQGFYIQKTEATVEVEVETRSKYHFVALLFSLVFLLMIGYFMFFLLFKSKDFMLHIS